MPYLALKNSLRSRSKTMSFLVVPTLPVEPETFVVRDLGRSTGSLWVAALTSLSLSEGFVRIWGVRCYWSRGFPTVSDFCCYSYA